MMKQRKKTANIPMAINFDSRMVLSFCALLTHENHEITNVSRSHNGDDSMALSHDD